MNVADYLILNKLNIVNSQLSENIPQTRTSIICQLRFLSTCLGRIQATMFRQIRNWDKGSSNNCKTP